jgi:hypothetical protein
VTAPLIIEQRLAALEMGVAQLKAHLEQLRKPEGNRAERMSGSMKDFPPEVLEEFRRCCAEAKREIDLAAENFDHTGLSDPGRRE